MGGGKINVNDILNLDQESDELPPDDEPIQLDEPSAFDQSAASAGKTKSAEAAGGTEGPSAKSNNTTRLALAVLGVMVLGYLVYDTVKPFLNQGGNAESASALALPTQAQATPVMPTPLEPPLAVPTAPVSPVPPAPVASIGPTVPPGTNPDPQQLDTVTTSVVELNELKTHFQQLTGQVSALAEKVDNLEAALAKRSERTTAVAAPTKAKPAKGQVAKKAASKKATDTVDKKAAKAKPAETTTAAVPAAEPAKAEPVKPEPVVAKYRARAIVEGRAWVDTPNGDTLTVGVGDHLAGLGEIRAIDPRRAEIHFAGGNVLRSE